MLATGGWSKIALSVEPGRMTRSFFGIYSIRNSGDGTRMLVHGTTIHGIQRHGSPELERYPTSYYARQSGVGLALAAAGDHARIDVVGLGAGTLACYSRPGQSWRFYEIDPAVVRIARNPKQFTFLSRCQPNARIAIGDARLTLERSPPASADILVVDAFSSDSVPMHLLTREAFRAYRRHLAPGGLLLVHISNRFLDLSPVVAAEVERRLDGAGCAPSSPMTSRIAQLADRLDVDRAVAVGQTIERLENASGAGRWTPLAPRPGFAPWTDDHASILPMIKQTSPLADDPSRRWIALMRCRLALVERTHLCAGALDRGEVVRREAALVLELVGAECVDIAQRDASSGRRAIAAAQRLLRRDPAFALRRTGRRGEPLRLARRGLKAASPPRAERPARPAGWRAPR